MVERDGFFLVGLADCKRSPAGRTWLAAEMWQPYTGPMALVPVTLCFAPEQAGQSYTLHLQAAGGTPCMQQVSPSPSGAFSGVDADWTSFTLQEGAGVIGCAVGYGMEFWLTRDSDGASSPHFWHTNQGFDGCAPAAWNLQGASPPPAANRS